ncbi:MAG TPA: ATP-binding protein [Candidatus Saccharimonadales bacterium]|nr:ATP-binding protein [Candidatus Saccharimonadales bacterium]
MSLESIETVRAERDRLARALKEQTAQVEAVNKEFEQFSHSLSHDLRAPLRALEGFAQILIEDYSPSLDAEGKRCVEILCQSARKASSLIEDLLVLSRLCRRPFTVRPFNMRGVVSRQVAELQAEGVTAPFQIDDLPDAVGDAESVSKIWEQLLRNAVKFTGRQSKPLIELGGRIEAERLVYFVRDNGVGFEPKYAGRLFGIFQRLHGEQEFEGRGIGLAVVKRLVHRHGGEVWAEGTVNKGATFSFSLPLPPASGAAPP